MTPHPYEPRVAWEDSTGYRLVYTPNYNHSGRARAVLEVRGDDAMGEERWVAIEVPPVAEDALWRLAQDLEVQRG